jgi:hypothetical protein
VSQQMAASTTEGAGVRVMGRRGESQVYAHLGSASLQP